MCDFGVASGGTIRLPHRAHLITHNRSRYGNSGHFAFASFNRRLFLCDGGADCVFFATAYGAGLVAKLSNVWFEEEGRLQATALSSMALFVGIGLAFVAVPIIGGKSLWLDVYVLVALAGLVWFFVPADARQTETLDNATKASWGKDLVVMLRNPVFLLLTGYFFFANGYFNAISAWLQPILKPHGVDPKTAGMVALGMLVAGIVAMALADKIAQWVSLRVLLIVASIVPVGVTLVFFNTGNVFFLCAAAVVLGITLLAPLPLLIDSVVATVGGGQDGTAASVFWMVGNAGAVVYMGMFGPIADSNSWSLGCILLIGLLIVQLILGGIGWRFSALRRKA